MGISENPSQFFFFFFFWVVFFLLLVLSFFFFLLNHEKSGFERGSVFLFFYFPFKEDGKEKNSLLFFFFFFFWCVCVCVFVCVCVIRWNHETNGFERVPYCLSQKSQVLNMNFSFLKSIGLSFQVISTVLRIGLKIRLIESIPYNPWNFK